MAGMGVSGEDGAPFAVSWEPMAPVVDSERSALRSRERSRRASRRSASSRTACARGATGTPGARRQRAAVGHGARGLQRQRHRVGVPAARPRSLARLPLGRGRPRRLLRRRAAALPRPRALERPRPDPEGAHLRAHRQPGQPRRGRQGVLVVPRRDAEPLVEPRGATTTRRARSRTSELVEENARARQARPGVRAARHRDLRRRPLLDRRGALREGRRRSTSCSPSRSRTPAPRRTTLHVLPTAWYRNTWAWDPGGDAPELRADGDGATDRDRAPVSRAARARRRRRPGRRAPRLLFCDNETNAERLFGLPAPRYPKDGISDHVVAGAETVNPAGAAPRPPSTTSVTVAPGATVALRVRLRPAASPPARPWDDFADVVDGAAARGGRVLRGADAGGLPRRRGERDAAGVRGDAVGQAALLLRRRALARRRPDAAAPAGLAPARAQRGLGQLRGLRHHVDAGSVGVPVVRGVGHGVPLRRARPRRPGLREVPAAPALPRVVPASERCAARLRVVVRRRQPAGAGVGGAAGVRRSTAAATSSS